MTGRFFSSAVGFACAAAVFSVGATPSFASTPSRLPGLGAAGVAIADDLGSISLNPAGLAALDENEAAAGVAAVPSGVDFSAAYAHIFPAVGTSAAAFRKNLASADVAFAAAFARRQKAGFMPPFYWGVKLGAGSAGQSGLKPEFALGAQTALDIWRIGASVISANEKTALRAGGATKFLDEHLVALDIDSDAEIYLGLETGVYGDLGRLRAGINSRDRALFVGFGAYLWPYAIDAYCSLPFEMSRGPRVGFSFAYRFGGYNFSQVLLDRNTEKSMSLERKIKDARRDLAALNKKLAETEDAYKKARDFVDILDSEASELIKKKLQMMKGADMSAPAAPAPPRQAASPRETKKTWPARHRVLQGDSLRSLAQQYYGDANKWQKIYEANRGKIERGLPKLGEEIIIPAP